MTSNSKTKPASKPTGDTTASNKLTRLQLQGRHDRVNKMSFSMDSTALENMEACERLVEQMLNLKVSRAVLMRRAMRAYRDHLTQMIFKFGTAQRKGDPHAVDEFCLELDQERCCLFETAGRTIEQATWDLKQKAKAGKRPNKKGDRQ